MWFLRVLKLHNFALHNGDYVATAVFFFFFYYSKDNHSLKKKKKLVINTTRILCYKIYYNCVHFNLTSL